MYIFFAFNKNFKCDFNIQNIGITEQDIGSDKNNSLNIEYALPHTSKAWVFVFVMRYLLVQLFDLLPKKKKSMRTRYLKDE